MEGRLKPLDIKTEYSYNKKQNNNLKYLGTFLFELEG